MAIMKRLYFMSLHFWVHILRFSTAVAALVMTIRFTVRLPTFVVRPNYPSDLPRGHVSFARELDARNALLRNMLFAFLIPLLLNDSLMLTFDYYRTGSYFGSVVVQTGVSAATLALASTALGAWYRLPPDDFKPFQSWVLWWTPVWAILLGFIALSSLCLTGTLVWATLQPPHCIPLRQIWESNTKDVLWGVTAGSKRPQLAHPWSLTGRPRDIPVSVKRELCQVTAPPQRFITQVLFRRVSPAESKSHALARNAFAVLAMFLIIFRAIVALSRANNKLETRLQSKPCVNSFDIMNTRIFMAQADISGATQGLNQVPIVNITTDAGGTEACTVARLGRELRTTPSDKVGFSRYHDFSCYLNYTFDGIPVSYDITVPFPPVVRGYSPLVWMFNHHDLDNPINASMASIMKDAAPAYIPGWQLRHGYHLEGEARIVKRRVITSSAWRDLLINLDPQYAEISLYPITLTSATRLANETAASARLRISFDSSFSFLGSEKEVWNSKNGQIAFPPVVCDTIEDYRSSTVMDVIGSVGGLFALLQAVHILLFGRPLLWGLTGAKLITPFGLFGACSSRGFKRRLREQYHRQPTGDDPNPIQIGTFLRDFVIDFGPAGVDVGQLESKDTLQRDLVLKEGDKNESAEVHVPLMRIPSSILPTPGALFSENNSPAAGA